MIFDRAFWVIRMFRLESQNWLTIMIQFDYSIAWEVASETHCAKYGVEIANQTFIKRKLWHLTKKTMFLWQDGKNEKASSVIKSILKLTRQPGGQSDIKVDATVEPRLSGFLDHPDFFSNPIFPEYLLAMIEIRSHIF